MCSFRDVQRHIHAEAIDGWTCHSNLCSIAEVRELHEVIQLVVGSDRRITQNVAHIGGTQHIQTSTHIEVFEWSVHHGKDIDEGLAIGHTLGMLLGTDNLEVVGLHTQINHNLFEVAEVDITLYVQRVVVMGIHRKVLKQQVRMLDAYGVVVKA